MGVLYTKPNTYDRLYLIAVLPLGMRSLFF